MSWFADRTGIHLGNIGAPIGALVGSIVPGVGTALGAGLGQGLGALGSGKGVGTAAGQGAAAYGGAKVLGSVLGGGNSEGGSGGGLDLSGLLGKLGPSVAGLLPHNASGGIDLGALVNPALGGAAMLNAANLQKQSTDYANNAMNTVNQSYDSRAPLRTQGLAGLQNPGAGIDLSGLKRISARNSFAS